MLPHQTVGWSTSGRITAEHNMIVCLRRRPVRMTAALGVAVTALGVVATVDAPASASNARSCFLLHSWDGQWKVSPNSRSLYVKENGVIFRIDLAQPAPMLQSSFSILNTAGSSEAVCRPEDLHLVVTDRLGGMQTAIARKVVRLTPAEAAALPKNLKP